MNIKKILINSISIFIITWILHFSYDVFPSFITAIFTPVNESIFEHLKLIFTSSIVFTFISNVILKNKNAFLIAFLRGLLNIIILLVIYLPIRLLFGENLVITLIILFVTLMITEIIINFLPQKNYKKLSTMSIFLIILCYIIFTYLSYNPPKTFLFYDTKTNSYGIYDRIE